MFTETHVAGSAWGVSNDGQPVKLFTLSNAFAEVKLTAYGARIVAVKTKDEKDNFGDIVLGADTLKPYLDEPNFYLGCTIGRFANRIGNGRFMLHGREYVVPQNNGSTALHGGTVGFDSKVWSSREVPNGVEFTYISPDGEMGFPGNLRAVVTYTLVKNALRLDYVATTDATTLVNLTNHTYWNLSGKTVDVGAHQIAIAAAAYTPTDASQVPTGEIAPVAGTPLDLRQPQEICRGWDDAFSQIQDAKGYDHNFVLDGSETRQLALAARVREPESGRTLSVYTTEPAVQFYTGNFLTGAFPGRNGMLRKRTGFCLETQNFPDAPNHTNFPSAVLEPNEVYRSTTVFIFQE